MYIAGLELGDGSAWRLAKSLCGGNNVSGPLESPGGLAYSAVDKAEVFADCMEEQFQPNEGIEEDTTQ